MAKPDAKSAHLSDDGELVHAFFCLYCGQLNTFGADVCVRCGQYIADQGPDLSSRLRRIRRRASSVQASAESPQSGLRRSSVETPDPVELQSPANEGELTWHDVEIAPILARITQVASHISPPPKPPGLEYAGKVSWLIVFVIIMYPLLLVSAVFFIDLFARLTRSMAVR